MAAFIRSEIPARRKAEFEPGELESISLEVYLNRSKWLFTSVYRPPNLKDNLFFNTLVPNVDNIISQYDHCMFLGDFNYDL